MLDNQPTNLTTSNAADSSTPAMVFYVGSPLRESVQSAGEKAVISNQFSEKSDGGLNR